MIEYYISILFNAIQSIYLIDQTITKKKARLTSLFSSKFRLDNNLILLKYRSKTVCLIGVLLGCT